VKPETQNRRLAPLGLGKPEETRGLTGMCPCLDRHELAGQGFGRVWNRTDPFLHSKPGLLAGSPDPLLTLVSIYNTGSLRLDKDTVFACLSVNLQ
jgi:hypothetical protein